MRFDAVFSLMMVVFIASFLFGVWIDNKSYKLIEDYLPSIAVIVAAYLGAKFAFLYQVEQNQKGTRQKNTLAGNVALHNVFQMKKMLSEYEKSHVKSIKIATSNWVLMRSTPVINNSDYALNLESLSFLLQSNNSELLGELFDVKRQFEITIDNINSRSELYNSLVKPRKNYSSFMSSFNTVEIDLLKESSRAVITSVGLTVKLLEEVEVKLGAVLE